MIGLLQRSRRPASRPSFSPVATPDLGMRLFTNLCERVTASHPRVACGRFGAEMQVALVNDGPVTFWLQVRGES